MKKLLILLLLCSCATQKIPDDMKMKCANLGYGMQQCENKYKVCMRQISYSPQRGVSSQITGCKDKKINKGEI